MGILFVLVCIMYVPVDQAKEKGVLNILETELHKIVSHHVSVKKLSPHPLQEQTVFLSTESSCQL